MLKKHIVVMPSDEELIPKRSKMVSTVMASILIIVSHLFNTWNITEQTKRQRAYTKFKNKKTKARLRGEFAVIIKTLLNEKTQEEDHGKLRTPQDIGSL